MARHVKISVIGCGQEALPPGVTGQAAVDRMIEFWNRKFDEVLPDRPDLIVVPEVCDCPAGLSFKDQADYYRVRGAQVAERFAGTARANRCYIAYAAVRDAGDGTWRNSVQLFDRQGRLAGVYNKNHVVIEETTEGGMLCGKDAPLIRCDFGTVACAICFDLNFDELWQKYATLRPDLVLFCSMYHGGLMQAYPDSSCRAHFAAALCGREKRSAILSPVGETLAATTNYVDHATARVNLDCAVAHFDCNGERFVNLKRKYGAGVTVHDPGLLGSVLLTCEREDMTIGQMAKEFGIEMLDDYFARALAHHHDPRNRER
jgi:predicted amidohydrolase